MHKINECLTSRSEITQLHQLSNSNIIYSTKLHGVKILSAEDCIVERNLSSKHLNSKTTATAFSNNGELLAFSNSSAIYVIYIPTHKIIKTIKLVNESVEILAFDPSSTYIIAGTKNGRVLQYRYNSTSLLSRLCSFPHQRKDERIIKIRQNFVSAFTFFENKMACSGYGGSIFILDLHSRVNSSIISHSRVRINAICFLDIDTIITGNVDGVIQITSLRDKRVNKRINAPLMKINQIILMPNPDYIIVSSESNYLTLINIKTFKVIDSKYLEFQEKINKILLLEDESLLVALANKTLLKIELPSISRLNSLITHNSLDEAFALVAKEPMIRGSQEHIKLEEAYQAFLSKAIKALIHNDKDLAKQLTNMFKNIPSKKEEIRSLFDGFEKYSRLQALFLERKYALAYAMCSKYPALKQTQQFKKMEKIWKVSFNDAQRQIALGRDDIAKSILSEYMTIAAKRPLIKFILNHNKKFLEFLKAVDRKEFSKLNTLIKENEMFTQIPTYIALNNEIQGYLDEIKECFRVGNIELANIFLLKIETIPYLKGEVEKFQVEAKHIQKLHTAYNKGDFISCYTILDTYQSLNSIELGKFLQKHWSKRVTKCEEYAIEGNIKALKQILGELLKLPTRKEKIGDLLRTSFHSKIELLTKKKSFKNAENIIYSYIDIFGLDSEIELASHTFEEISGTKLAIVEDQHRKKSRDAWFTSALIMK
ncbi:MAG: hypothetical protein DRG78_08425 [Epsilonproteobacteria bacterium]|nr:MAG: hypothetical protein DRG78_08425 [Campylobacterota bacterium]